MKKASKMIVPILLALIVVASIIWYLLQYDPGFTQDMLLRRARLADERGNHRTAAWYYDLAYRHSDEDEAVAIELAEQFKSSGNYTKAEYTLSNAIADGGSARLYAALCKTYVEQDKLLDAVTMLDNIADPDIKAELEAQRPKAPEATPGDGYYNEYLDVVMTAQGTIYISTDGEYPSLKDEPFDGTYSLPGGETTIFALCIGENGLVSPLRILGYTVAGVIEEVSIADSGLDAIIRKALDVTEDHILYSNQLWGLTSLEITSGVKDLSELAQLPFLEHLVISEGNYTNLSSISSLTNLKSLSIDGVTLSTEDVKAIAAAPDLTVLTLRRCNLSDIGDLAGAVGLTELDLSSNTIGDLEPLSKMTELTQLDLSHNAITQLTALTGAAKLQYLDVSYNSVSSTAALSGCKALETLVIDFNSLNKLEGLEKLEALKTIAADHNQISDVSNLGTAPVLQELSLSNNALTDISALGSITKLKTLAFANNQVANLPPFTSSCQLSVIDGSRNKIVSLDPLSCLSQLNYVTMDYNSGIRTLNPLSRCSNLVEVSAYGTAVTEAASLLQMNVIVKYAPAAG